MPTAPLPQHGPGICVVTQDGVSFTEGMTCWDRNGDSYVIDFAEACYMVG